MGNRKILTEQDIRQVVREVVDEVVEEMTGAGSGAAAGFAGSGFGSDALSPNDKDRPNLTEDSLEEEDMPLSTPEIRRDFFAKHRAEVESLDDDELRRRHMLGDTMAGKELMKRMDAVSRSVERDMNLAEE